MNKIKLDSNTMYILSGATGSGKSFSVKNLTEHVVSSDTFRKMVLPPRFKNNNCMTNSENANDIVFKMMEMVIRKKCEEGLTVFIDATNTTENDRSKWVKIAEEYNMEYKIIIFDLPLNKIKSFNKERTFSVENYVIEKFYDKLERTSVYPYIVFNDLVEFSLKPKFSIQGNIDFIGDTHGCLKKTKELISKLGYNEDLSHPQSRKLLFLGDFVDRGPDSIEMIRFVKNACENGHYAILGNHELKLIKNFNKILKKEIVKGSVATRITATELFKQKDKEALINFIKSLPFYYVVNQKYLCVHANIVDTNPLTLTKSLAAYGDIYIDTDSMCDAKSNPYDLVRGHIEKTTENTNVIVLETKGSFGGSISSYNSNSKIYTSLETNFDYSKSKKHSLLYKKLNEHELISKRYSGLFTLFKYKTKVFYNSLWDNTLLKARGVVFDIAENIMQHPFDKVFNYLENGTAKNIKDHEVFTAVEKMNGFLLNVSYNPYENNLLVSTTGSLNSEFVDMGKELISKENLYGPLFQYLREHNITLSFEAIHSKDPHIIKYDTEGLWLIGARERVESAKSMTEHEVSDIANEISSLYNVNIKRPRVFKSTFGNLKKLAKTKKIEGYMIRNGNDYICKFKTHHYLTIKFLSRMNEGKIKFMFNNTKEFKKNSDEDVFMLIDKLVSSVYLEDFIQMNNTERRDFILNLLSE